MKTVEPQWIERIIDAALAARGVERRHRRYVIDGILFSALRGIDSHGVPLVRTYLEEVRRGRANACPRFTYTHERSAIARLDADGALGMVAGFEATHKVASLAKEHGIGLVVVANSNHFGAASIFSCALARGGLIGLAVTNSDALVVPFNGRSKRLGTNPISMAAQGVGSEMFCTDLATSQGSFLRSFTARTQGAPVAPGVLADEQGGDVASSGAPPAALLPLGGHKGQCLGMMVSVLCALLSGGPFDWEIANLFEPPFEEPRGISHLLLGIEIGAVAELDGFRGRLSEYLQAFRSTPTSAGTAVSCPGDAEEATARARASQGIPVTESDHAFLTQLERELGVFTAKANAGGR